MTLPPLTIVTAGAGSGKTHTLQHKLGGWIVDGLVDPERIVAVTFTEAAATELRERIRGHLIKLGRLEDAKKLDAAYISTIHSFGLRLLTEFAFEAGMSPDPRLLTQSEQETLVRLAVATTDQVDFMMDNLRSYGYRYDYYNKAAPEQVLRLDVRNMVDLLRRAGRQASNSSDSHSLGDWLKNGYGFVQNSGILNDRLRRAAVSLLVKFPTSLEGLYPKNGAATTDLARDFRNLKKVEQRWHEKDWQLWADLCEMRKTKRGAKLPDGYDDLADVVIEVTMELPSHPGPLEKATRHAHGVAGAARDVLQHYSDEKRKAGLVDYTDMVALAENLLKSSPAVLKTVKDRISCLVIDEFQDTNPLQFSLLWKLTEAGVPTLAVGDIKQAIMGFQGADARLLAALEQKHPEESITLPDNYRTQPPLLEFINAAGRCLFGDQYVDQKAKGATSQLSPLEAIRYAEGVTHAERAAATAQYICKLLNDPAAKVNDRELGQSRPIRGSDIAVLCGTHVALEHYNTALTAAGLRTRLQQKGWFQSRIVQIVFHALTYLANPSDRYAALYLSVTELGDVPLNNGLESLIDHEAVESHILDKLNGIETPESRPLPELIACVIDALDLYDIVLRWPSADQARTNLIRLQGEAVNFVTANREALAAGGYHGYGVDTFLSWITDRCQDDKENVQPAPRDVDEDAINLVTMHKAKGLEWPVVVLGFLERQVTANLPDSGIHYEDFDDPGIALEAARLWYTPRFDSPETNQRFLLELGRQAEIEAKRLLYVAITRAREKLVLEWPEFYKSKNDVPCYWSILRNACHAVLGESGLEIESTVFPCKIVSPHIGAGLQEVEPEVLLIPFGRRAIQPGAVSGSLTPDSVTPSEIAVMNVESANGEVRMETYGDGLELDLGLSPTDSGTLIHRCLEVLGHDPSLTQRLPEICGYALDATNIEKIAGSAAAFESWRRKQFGECAIHRELPVIALNKEGSVISGVADVVLDSPSVLCIIDHKSSRGGDLEESLQLYVPQLMTYAAALNSYFGKRDRVFVGINWTFHGKVSLLQIQ